MASNWHKMCAKQVGTNTWHAYRWDGVKWYEVGRPAVDAGATPIGCGEGIKFIHNGIPGRPDTPTFPTPPAAYI